MVPPLQVPLQIDGMCPQMVTAAAPRAATTMMSATEGGTDKVLPSAPTPANMAIIRLHVARVQSMAEPREVLRARA